MSVILISYQNDRLLSEAAVAAIRAIFEDEGDLRAAVEARGSFPGVSDWREAWTSRVDRRWVAAATLALSSVRRLPTDAR